MKNPRCTDTHEAPRAVPPSFAERLARLQGESTWREPVEGRSTSVKPIPAAHQLAMALSMGRIMVAGGPQGESRPDPSDIGPDIAFDIVTRGTSYAVRSCRIVADAIAKDRARAARRNRQWLRIVCWAAYVEVVYGQHQAQLRPAEVTEADWELLTDAAVRIFETLAEDAVQRAERAYYRRERRVA